MSKLIIQPFERPFETESGAVLPNPEIAYQSWGTLNSAKDNVVFICHALTGNTAADEWFGGLIGSGKAIDPEKHFIICPNILGSCYGSSGPTSIQPETGKPYQANFPDITIRDIVRFHQRLLNHLQIAGIELIVGGSLGGMTALEFSLMDERIKAAALFAMGKAHTPWAIGISEAQRMAVYADENWNGGFYDEKHPPKKGLAAARAMAMITYRSPQNYTQKFGRSFHSEDKKYQVESYLNYQGNKLVHRFDANAYITLTKAMDRHDVSLNRGSFEETLGNLQQPVLVVGFDSDMLYPIAEQKELAALIPKAQLAEIKSPYGHDAFLIEFDELNHELSSFSHSHLEAKPCPSL
jgi:homoserine O-acetyltransferase